MENTECKNCGNLFKGNFCHNCGQKKYKRIDRKYITDELQYSLLHTSKGFFYSVKNVLKTPGKTAREYIDGKRVSHYKPILLAFVLSGVSAFISYKLFHLDDFQLEQVGDVYRSDESKLIMKKVMSFIKNYSSFIMIACIPLFALCSKIVFNNWKHNYYEHIVMNAFLTSYYTLISILLSPILYLFKDNISLYITLSTTLTFVLTPILFFIFYKGFYQEKKLGSIIGRVFWLLFVTFIIFILIYIISILVLVIKYYKY